MKKLSEIELIIIQKYLGAGLSKNDQQKFDIMFNEKNFKDELLFQAEMIEEISLLRREEIKGVLQEAKFEFESKKPVAAKEPIKTKPIFKYLWALLATLFLALIINYFFMQSSANKHKADGSNVFAEYYSPYPPSKIKRGVSLDNSVSTNSGMAYYAQKKYDSALEEFRKIQSPSDKIELYKAISYFEIGEARTSIEILQNLRQSKDGQIREQADWYSMLFYIKTSNKNDANILMDHILSNKAHLFYIKAKVITAEYFY